MTKEIKQMAMLAVVATLFSCSGAGDNAETNKEPPGPVTEMDRSRYNLNAPDEMMHEMQDSALMDTSENGEMQDTLID